MGEAAALARASLTIAVLVVTVQDFTLVHGLQLIGKMPLFRVKTSVRIVTFVEMVLSPVRPTWVFTLNL